MCKLLMISVFKPMFISGNIFHTGDETVKITVITDALKHLNSTQATDVTPLLSIIPALLSWHSKVSVKGGL